MAADTGMDTCPSPEISDSRKRPLDVDSENGDVKRSHFSSVQDLVTALPLANGHGNVASHFGCRGTTEEGRQHQRTWPVLCNPSTKNLEEVDEIESIAHKEQEDDNAHQSDAAAAD